MLLKYAILALLALFIIPILAINAYEIWTKPLKFVQIEEPSKKLEPKMEKQQSSSEVVKESDSIQSYIFISEKNISSVSNRRPDKKPPIL